MPSNVPENKKENYINLFASCLIKEARYPEIDAIISKMLQHKSRYEEVAEAVNIPWFFVAIVHCMEANQNFSEHLHNGDPLTKRTTHVPAGRPKTGTPPFSWEFSAKDALVFDKLDQWNDWSIAGMLYRLELYNGLGYYKQGINSPYLWSYSNHYSKGKYVQDGHFDPNAVSKQVGAAVLLRRLREKQLIELPEGDIVQQILAYGKTTTFYKGTVTDAAKSLQTLLNKAGAVLRVDGKAGELTSNEYFKFSGKYLTGDPRNR